MNIPPPDIAWLPKFVTDWTIVEAIYSDDKHSRVLITKDSKGLYRIHPERWDVSDLTTMGGAFWNQWGQHASFTDDVAIARQMAREALPAIPRSTVMFSDDEA